MMKRTNINDLIAGKLADWLATVVVFYMVCFLTLSILFFQMPKTALEWVQYIVQTVFQGISLPILALVAKQEGTKMAKMLKETHDGVRVELKELKAIMDSMHITLKEKC
jgi:hypothetical protein